MVKRNGNSDKVMFDINMTPLIDVMLVLIIMFIIALPRATHAVKVDLAEGKGLFQPNPVVNRVAVAADGTVSWNGSPVDLLVLRQYLGTAVSMVPQPELQFRPDPAARYARVDETMAAIKKAGVTKMGFVGNELYAGMF